MPGSTRDLSVQYVRLGSRADPKHATATYRIRDLRTYKETVYSFRRDAMPVLSITTEPRTLEIPRDTTRLWFSNRTVHGTSESCKEISDIELGIQTQRNEAHVHSMADPAEMGVIHRTLNIPEKIKNAFIRSFSHCRRTFGAGMRPSRPNESAYSPEATAHDKLGEGRKVK